MARHRSSSEEHLRRATFLFTPAPSPSHTFGSRHRRKNASCAELMSRVSFSLASPLYSDSPSEESEDDDDNDPYAYPPSYAQTNRLFGLASDPQDHPGPSRPRSSKSSLTLACRKYRPKLIATQPGMGAGETETEVDEPSKHLPTARIVPESDPIIPPSPFQQLIPVLFQLACLLSVLPATAAFIWCILRAFYPPHPSDFAHTTRPPPQSLDYLMASLWTILTAHQVLALTSGLLNRWRLYYPPLSTLIRLLALQSICWPLTHLTLLLLDAGARPITAWAVIGTFTSMSRSVQIWVTSNLWWSKTAPASSNSPERGYWRRVVGGGTWGGRRWDWNEVAIKCMFPVGCLYFLMAWVGEFRREWGQP